MECKIGQKSCLNGSKGVAESQLNIFWKNHKHIVNVHDNIIKAHYKKYYHNMQFKLLKILSKAKFFDIWALKGFRDHLGLLFLRIFVAHKMRFKIHLQGMCRARSWRRKSYRALKSTRRAFYLHRERERVRVSERIERKKGRKKERWREKKVGDI